jgi:hypothetical protein
MLESGDVLRHIYEDDRLHGIVLGLACMKALVFTKGSPTCMEGKPSISQILKGS